MIRKDREELRWILDMAKATGKLARCRFSTSELKFDIVPGAGIKPQTADALSHLKTNGKDRTILGNDISILTASEEFFAVTTVTETTELEPIDEFKSLFVLFIPEICVMVGITDNENSEILTLIEFNAVQCTDSVCRAAPVPVGKPNIHCSMDGGGVLLTVSPMDCTLQQTVPASLRTCFVHYFHYLLLVEHSVERHVYDFVRKE